MPDEDTARRRRTFLKGSAVALAMGVAGCSGGGGGSGGSDGGSDSSGGSDGSGGDPMLRDDSEFEYANPNWEESNYLLSAVDKNDYFAGSKTDLENMRSRDIEEIAHGEPPRELPDDESEWVDPDPLVFVDKPGEVGQAQFQENFQPLLDRIEETTGRSVKWQPVDNNAASVEALRSGRGHFGNVSTGTAGFAVNLGGVVPFADEINPSGEYGYRLLAIAQADADDIQSVEDFARDDVKVAHSEAASNSGHQAPSALFDQYFDVTPGDDYEVNFSGGHDQTGRGVFVGDYDAGPICSTCFDELIQANDDMNYDDFKVVWGSNPFPGGPLVYRYNLHPDLVEGIKKATIGTDWKGSEFAEKTLQADFVPVDFKTVYHDILVIQRYNGVEYNSGAL